MDMYTILACILTGAMVFLIICFGVSMILLAVNSIRDKKMEAQESVIFIEAKNPEGN